MSRDDANGAPRAGATAGPEAGRGAPVGWLALVPGLLALFSDKAFTIDDTLFLKLAEQIQRDPIAFFDFTVNWYGTESPMHEVTRNPPLVGHAIALLAGLVGWSERALHLGFLLPATAVTVFSWALARRLCERPVEATLIGLLTPAFLVSSTSLMCDTSMLALWCGALWLWLSGFDRDSMGRLVAAALLASLAVLTKYFALSLVPLMLAYGGLRTRRAGAWLAPLALPVAVAVGYDVFTAHVYGRGLLFDAAVYAMQYRDDGVPRSFATASFVGAMFAGGCLVPLLFLSPLLVRGRVLAGGALALAAGAAWWALQGSFAGVEIPPSTTGRLGIAAQGMAMAITGLGLVALAASDLRRRRDAESWLLALWIAGTLVFSSYLNWVANGRSVLPMAPALGILVMRRIDAPVRGVLSRRWLVPAMVPGAVVALLVTWGDYRWANGAREAVETIAARHMQQAPPQRAVYFSGHWGFQYYMERRGAVPLDRENHDVRPGDLVVGPSNNVDVVKVSLDLLERIDSVVVAEPRWVHVMKRQIGAGFYASNVGPMPFVFGRTVPDYYRIWRVRVGFRSGGGGAG